MQQTHQLKELSKLNFKQMMQVKNQFSRTELTNLQRVQLLYQGEALNVAPSLKKTAAVLTREK